MADTLKRTFHGCLTCRKRKVRCLGGSPSCQNCSRMNITCHSSFETNLRIRVSTPTGQKLVDNRPAPPIRGPRRCLLQPPAAAPAPAFDHTHQRQQNETYPSITFEPHFSSFSLSQSPPPPPPPPPTAGYGQGQGGGLAVQVPPQYTTTTTPAAVSIPSFDNGLYNWNSSFDFSCVDPSLDPGFGNGFSNGVLAGMVNSSSTMGYGDLMPGLLLPPGFATSAQMPGLVVVSSESDFGGGGGGGIFLPGGQEGTKEWVPKRRKRSKKVVEKEGEGEGGGWSYHRPQPYHLA
ncbi:uncharacterized protein QC763_205450 [Podospora pseudopauciseta]|uniref:Zn(2)-C6 fungal-type domain-containing protein n=1 Tax=Podospora pseudopauciseta TaxID=2093780 RepID=A0ABR0HNS0_9PEZI|nr:hypothetical protein QC763_205450 [Podospora pseudopauciseta]